MPRCHGLFTSSECASVGGTALSAFCGAALGAFGAPSVTLCAGFGALSVSLCVPERRPCVASGPVVARVRIWDGWPDSGAGEPSPRRVDNGNTGS